MRDYFHYDVHFVMNITDVDDKVPPIPLYVYNFPSDDKLINKI